MASGEHFRLIRKNANAASAAATAQARADQSPVVNSGAMTIRTGTVVWDPASMAAGAQVNTTVTVTGAVVGDAVAAGFSTALPAGVLISAAVTAADTVRVTLLNESGVVQDLASGTLRAQVFRQTS